MRAKEKAKYLIDEFINEQPVLDETDEDFEVKKREMYFARRCATTCVKEIIVDYQDGMPDIKKKRVYETLAIQICKEKIDYWNQVLTELNKM